MSNARSTVYECLSCEKKTMFHSYELIRASGLRCRHCGSSSMLESVKGGKKLVKHSDHKRIVIAQREGEQHEL